jgi:hypothetical protein
MTIRQDFIDTIAHVAYHAPAEQHHKLRAIVADFAHLATAAGDDPDGADGFRVDPALGRDVLKALYDALLG